MSVAEPPLWPWEAYAAGSEVEHFAAFCAEHLIQSVDDWDGLPLVLEDWELELMGEALAYDEAGLPLWRGFLIVLPRKNGKTHLLAAYALYRLLTSDGSPEILLAASSDKQAGRLFDAAVSFVRNSPLLSELLGVRDTLGEIYRRDGKGVIVRMSTDPKTLHGYNPSLVICDELAQWVTRSLRKAWAALTTGGGARRAPQTFVITTAGEASERDTGLLGEMLNRLEERGDVVSRPGLKVMRHFGSRRAAYVYESPSSKPDDLEAHKLANPASWITTNFLREQRENPELDDATFLQLHCNVWAEAGEQWVKNWTEFEVGPIPDGEPVVCAVDAAISYDCAAVVEAWLNPQNGKVRFQGQVWSTRDDAVAHHHVDRGEYLKLSRLRERLREIKAERRVLSVVYDPAYFHESAEELANEGFPMVVLEQNSQAMKDAVNGFYRATVAGTVEHDGDAVIANHVRSAQGKKTDSGWRVSKVATAKRIDALIACVMAHWKASQSANLWVDLW